MTIQSIGLFEAKTHFSELVARAEKGEDIVITRHNKPVVRLVAVQAAPAVDAARRRAAIDALRAVGADIRREGGGMTQDEIVGQVREAREAQHARRLTAAGVE